MPLIEVEVVGEPTRPEGLAQRLADAAARVLSSGPQGCWVRVRFLPDDAYAENGGSGGVLPVFVKIIEYAQPAADVLPTRVAELTAAIASATDRPRENVHVIYEPPAVGRVAFGGRLVS